MMYGFSGERLGACFNNGGAGIFPFLHLGLGIFLLALAALAVYILVRRPGTYRTDAAAETLAVRLANGEIDEEEYQRKKKLLK